MGVRVVKKRRVKKKREMTHSTNWTHNHSSKRPTEEFFFFFPCHAFNGGLFPVGSALEVAPASVSLIFADRTMLYRLAVG